MSDELGGPKQVKGAAQIRDATQRVEIWKSHSDIPGEATEEKDESRREIDDVPLVIKEMVMEEQKTSPWYV